MKSWYQIQRKPKNCSLFLNFKNPMPVTSDAYFTVREKYYAAIKQYPDDEWRLVITDKRILLSTSKNDD